MLSNADFAARAAVEAFLNRGNSNVGSSSNVVAPSSNVAPSPPLTFCRARRDIATMFGFGKDDAVASKCYFTHGTLPKYIDPEQPPASKKPFSTIMGQAFTHTVLTILEFLLPN